MRPEVITILIRCFTLLNLLSTPFIHLTSSLRIDFFFYHSKFSSFLFLYSSINMSLYFLQFFIKLLDYFPTLFAKTGLLCVAFYFLSIKIFILFVSLFRCIFFGAWTTHSFFLLHLLQWSAANMSEISDAFLSFFLTKVFVCPFSVYLHASQFLFLLLQEFCIDNLLPVERWKTYPIILPILCVFSLLCFYNTKDRKPVIITFISFTLVAYLIP